MTLLDGAALAESERMVAGALIDPSAHAAGRLVLTPRGRLLADAVIRDLT
jgi:oxygen-independent coproporphyrinogen-3 oxidase